MGRLKFGLLAAVALAICSLAAFATPPPVDVPDVVSFAVVDVADEVANSIAPLATVTIADTATAHPLNQFSIDAVAGDSLSEVSPGDEVDPSASLTWTSSHEHEDPGRHRLERTG